MAAHRLVGGWLLAGGMAMTMAGELTALPKMMTMLMTGEHDVDRRAEPTVMMIFFFYWSINLRPSQVECRL